MRRLVTSAAAAAAVVLGVVVSLVPHGASAAAGPGTNYAVDDPFVSSRTAWWRDGKFGMFIHFGDYTYWGGEYQRSDGSVCKDAEWIKLNCSIPWDRYEAGAAKWNPSKFDANAIVKLAKDTGQKYIVFTAKHHDGYAMWPTAVNTWNLRDHSSFDKSRDILAELKAAADAQGVKFGLYYSITDWHEQDAGMPADQIKKNMYAQLKELMTSYHPALLWFDGQGRDWWTTADGENLQTYLHGLDPDLIINNRVTKKRIVDGDYATPEREAQIPTAPIKGAPWESCLTTGNRWGWTRYDTWKPTSQLTRDLLDIVGRDGNLLLNIGPDDTGVIPPAAATQLRGIGRWLATNGHSDAVYGATYTGLVDDPTWGAVTRKANNLYLSVYNWPAAGTPLHLTVHDSFTITAAQEQGSTAPVTWKASGDGYDITPSGTANSSIATVIELTVALQTGGTTGTGTGLKGQYWTNTTFTGAPAMTRTDASLNFAWRSKGTPDPAIPVDNFSARWSGYVQAQFTGPHTFVAVSDETVKVWVDGHVVIDHSTAHSAAVDSATVNLVAGKKYSIRVDYTEHTGEAYLKLLWFNPNRRQRIIPTSQLYPGP
jgi:alpha-L-fucosidase